MANELVKRLSAYELKVTQKDDLPLKVFESEFLKKALDSFNLAKPTRKGIKRLIKIEKFRKAFMYLFWIFVGLKFRSRSFGDRDHFNSNKDEVIKTLREENRFELYRVLEQDTLLGQSRRISFIKYWRLKFHDHLYDVRNRCDKLFTKCVQDVIPYVFGRAIILGFEELIRFGHEIISFKDPDCAQVYQLIFTETVGFKVDRVFVLKWLKKH